MLNRAGNQALRVSNLLGKQTRILGRRYVPKLTPFPLLIMGQILLRGPYLATPYDVGAPMRTTSQVILGVEKLLNGDISDVAKEKRLTLSITFDLCYM